MIKVSASILAANFSNLEKEVKKVIDANCDILHFDIMDGHFVPNLTFGPMIIKSLRKKCNLIFDAHLMVDNPDNYIDELKEYGTDIVTVHQEVCLHLNRTINKIKKLGMASVVALNPATPLSTLEYLIDNIDMVLLMSVNPGFSGQEFIPSTLIKIKQLRKMNKKIDIGVDGGINESNYKNVINAGANILVCASAIFSKNGEELKKFVDKIKKYKITK